jgi:hypothetical protein
VGCDSPSHLGSIICMQFGACQEQRDVNHMYVRHMIGPAFELRQARAACAILILCNGSATPSERLIIDCRTIVENIVRICASLVAVGTRGCVQRTLELHSSQDAQTVSWNSERWGPYVWSPLPHRVACDDDYSSSIASTRPQMLRWYC